MEESKTKHLVIPLAVTAIVIFMFNIFIDEPDVWKWLLAAFFLMFALPIFLIKYYFKKNTDEYFLKFKIKETDIWRSLIGIFIFFGIIVFFVLKFNLKNRLAVSPWVDSAASVVLFIDLLILPAVVLFQEFFFRGFLMVSIKKGLGFFSAIILQAVAVIGYEIFFKNFTDWPILVILFFFNILLGLLAFQNKSIFVPAFINWIVLVFVDLMVFYQISLIKGV